MKNEVWKPIKSYNGKFEGYYEISNLGRVRSIDRYVLQGGKQRHVREKIKKQVLNAYGYPCVCLCKNKVSRLYPIHRLICEAFIPNPENKPCVDHINTDRTDYRLENLRWVTFKENSNNPITKERAYKNSHSEEALAKSKRTKIKNNGITAPKKIYQYTLDGTFVAIFESARCASKITNIHPSDINSACVGKKASAGGYLWSRTGIPPKYNPYSANRKTILQLSLSGELVKEWDSLTNAATSLGIQISNIARCAKGHTNRTQCGGYQWKYKE